MSGLQQLWLRLVKSYSEVQEKNNFINYILKTTYQVIIILQATKFVINISGADRAPLCPPPTPLWCRWRGGARAFDGVIIIIYSRL